MPETIEAPVTQREPSMAQLRNMAKNSEPAQAEPAVDVAEPKTAEPAQAEQHTEAAPAPAHDKQQVEVEEELPENVRKRIAKEVERTTRIQSEIDRAVSTRKAKEQELAALNGKPGSEPAKTTEPEKDARPKRPDLASFPGTLAEYNTAVAEYETKFEDWIQKQTRDAVTKQFAEQQTQETAKKAWDEATAKHGADFPSLMEALGKAVPPGFQVAISALEDWSGVAVHLAQNEAERTALAEKFKSAPLAAVADLGKLEERLKPVAKETKPAEEKPALSKPLKPVAGGPRGTAPAVNLDDAPMSQFKREVNRMRGQ